MNILVNRLYECKACGHEYIAEEKCSAKFRRKCPCCNKHRLFLKSADSGMMVGVDTIKGKTVGSVAEQNTKRREKEGYVEKQPSKPWWRKNKKRVDIDVLKNPSKYIATGKK